MSQRGRLVLLLAVLGASAGVSAEPLHQAIDRLIAAGAKGALAPRCEDAEFLRRAMLDFAGNVPTAEQARAFLDDEAPDKRARLIERLLGDGAFAKHWADRLTVMLLERQKLGSISDEEWRAYLEGALSGRPRWDRMVSDMIVASGDGESRAAMRFLGNGDHHRLTEDIARLFLGRDLVCARCHDHPSVDEWTQADYWGLFAYLKQTKAAKRQGDGMPVFVEEPASGRTEFQSVFAGPKRETGPRLPGGEEIAIPEYENAQDAIEKPAADGLPAVPSFRPRELLARDLCSADNRHFVRNSLNRFWALMMGRGLWSPLDEAHSGNPPTHPELLDRLEREFVDHEFDLKWLLGEIALSESYQRSSRLPEGDGAAEPSAYRSAVPKALTPEQLLHAILRATGNEAVLTREAVEGESFDRRGYFTGTNTGLPTAYPDILAIFVETFGQPAGTPEDDFSPGANKALYLMNDRLILHWLEPRDGNLVERIGRLDSAESIADELYFAVLSRPPEPAEIEELAAYLETRAEDRDAALGDLAWALLSSTEFRFNH